jgi:hypothetical protein
VRKAIARRRTGDALRRNAHPTMPNQTFISPVTVHEPFAAIIPAGPVSRFALKSVRLRAGPARPRTP